MKSIAIAAMLIAALLGTAASANGTAPRDTVTVHDCTKAKTINFYHNGELVATGTRVVMPPYLCVFDWELR